MYNANEYYRQNPPTIYATPELRRPDGSIRMHEGYIVLVRTRTGDELHLAPLSSSRTFCGCRVATAVSADSGSTCENCTTTRTPMTKDEINEKLDVVRTPYGMGWKAKNPDAGRFIPMPTCPGSNKPAPPEAEWIKGKGRRSYFNSRVVCPDCGGTPTLSGHDWNAETRKPGYLTISPHWLPEPEEAAAVA